MKKIIGFGLVVQAVLFQVFVVTKARFLYGLLRVLFFAFLAVLLAALLRRLKKEPLLVLFLLLIVLVRVPFYLHSDGLITTSDNAHDALQAVEIRDTHTAPVFFLGYLKHIGTIKYLWVAFIGDLGGTSYLFYVLVQLALFIALLFALEALLRERLSRPAAWIILFLAQFAFAELLFDYSLSIRGAPYLEMILFFTFGFALVDFAFRDRAATFLGLFLVFFSMYIHPLASVLVGSAAVTILIFALVRKKLLPTVSLMAGGAAAALWHWGYYLFFTHPLQSEGSWEQVTMVPLSKVNPSYFRLFFHNVVETFHNLFGFEFDYLGPNNLPDSVRPVLTLINAAAAWIGLAALLAAVFILGRRLVRLFSGREALAESDWTPIFFFVLLGAVLVKTFLFFPAHPEPRHNFDWMYLVIMAVIVSGRAWIGKRRFFSFRGVAFILLAAVLTIPHYETYLRSVIRKEASDRELLALLRKDGIHAITTDFIIAYPVYYLSGRRIQVSDGLGPLTIHLFYPEMRNRVNALPPGRKAYVFFSDRYPSREWHKIATSIVLRHAEADLQWASVPYVVEETNDFVVLVPDQARHLPTGIVCDHR